MPTIEERTIRRLKVISEAKRCRDVYRYFPRGLEALDLTSALESSSDTPLPPSDFIPVASADTALIAFAQLTALRLKSARCLVSLIDSQHQYIIAESGPSFPLHHTPYNANDSNQLWLGNVVIPRRRGVCGQVINVAPILSTADNPGIVVINDLAQHELYGSQKFVHDHPGWRFYAGIPLYTPEGSAIGVICVFDGKPRTDGLTDEESAVLKDMAATTMKLLLSHKVQHDHIRGERMVRGLTDFLEGATDLRVSANDEEPWMGSEISSPETLASVRPTLMSRPPTQDLLPVLAASGLSVTETTFYPEINTSDRSPGWQEEAKNILLGQTPPSRAQPIQPDPEPTETAANLQESILPAKAKTMFSRAANIIRQTSDLDCVIFFDASIAAVGTKNTRMSFASTARTISGEGAKDLHTLRHGGAPSKALPTLSIDNYSSSESSGGRLREPERMSQVLGFCGLRKSSVLGHTAERLLTERMLKRLLKLYPGGKIINFNLNGEATTSSDDTAVEDLLSGDDDLPPEKQRVSRRTASHRRTIEALRTVAPDARSLCVLPLWDYERSRWFSCCLLWTTQPDRLLSANVDLVYLKAFGNSVMTELARLDEISSGRVKTNFVASISHELRSPLHGILGGIEFLQNTQLDAFQTAMIHSVATCGRTLLDVINHVLDFTKMNDFETGSGSVMQIRDDNTVYVSSRGSRLRSLPKLDNFHLVSNLRAVTEEVVESVFASQSYHTAQTNMEDDGVEAYDDEIDPEKPENNRKQVLMILDIGKEATKKLHMPSGAWRRILMNLVGNALKYTMSGFIKVAVRVSDTGQKLDSKNSRVFLTVSDSGIGMSKDFLVNRIFTPFTQENSFSSGVGLGLNLLRQIVDSLHGTIKVRSVLGQGTDIIVSLDLPNGEIDSSVDVEDPLSQIRERVHDKKICVLHATRFSTPSQSKAVRIFGDAICSTLVEWLGITPTVATEWTGQDADIIIITEPSFECLASIRRNTPEGQQPPMTLMLAVDAVEAEALRNDARVLSRESIVGVLTQPCGPYKLAKLLDHCLDRHERAPSEDSSHDSGLGDDVSVTPPVEKTLPEVHVRPATSNGPNYSFSTIHSPEIRSTYTVLIADDNAINRRLLVALMNKRGFAYYEAVDGLKALQIYKKHHENINCVLMDISMPIMDGMTSTRKIRAFESQNKLERTTIIALTGLVSASARLEALESGVDEFMTKPVNFSNLLKLMPDLMRNATVAAGAEEIAPNQKLPQRVLVQETEMGQPSSGSDNT